MKKIIIGLSALWAFNAFSGGMYWSFEITDFAVSKNDSLAYTFKAVPTKKDDYWEITQCDEITVSGNFDFKRWEPNTLMSPEKHAQSLVVLQNAYDKKATILFGKMGGGLKKTGTCQYQSKGLYHGKQDNSTPLVMSVYNIAKAK